MPPLWAELCKKTSSQRGLSATPKEKCFAQSSLSCFLTATGQPGLLLDRTSAAMDSAVVHWLPGAPFGDALLADVRRYGGRPRVPRLQQNISPTTKAVF